MANEISVRITGDARDFNAAVDSAQKKGSAFGNAMSGVAKVAGGFVLAQGLISAPRILGDAARAAADDAASTDRLRKAVENTGAPYATYAASLRETITSAQKMAFTDDQARSSLALLMAQTGNAEEAQMRFKLAMDLSRGANIDLETASKLLGKVTEENVNVLGRYGIVVAEGATEAELFGAVQAKFAGQAETFAKSTAGQMETASNQMGELQEQIGAALLPAMLKIATVLNEQVIPAIAKFIEWLGPHIREVVEAVRPKLAEFASFAREQFIRFAAYYQENIKPALENIIAGVSAVVGFIREHWPQIETIVRPILEQVQNIVQTVFGVITGILNTLILLIKGDFSGAWNALKDTVGVALNGVKESIENGIQLIKGLVGNMILIGQDIVFGFIDGIKSMAGKIIDTIKEFVTDRIPGFIKTVFGIGSPSKLFAGFGEDMMEGLAQGIATGSAAPINAMQNAAAAILGAMNDALAQVSRGQRGPEGAQRHGSITRQNPITGEQEMIAHIDPNTGDWVAGPGPQINHITLQVGGHSITDLVVHGLQAAVESGRVNSVVFDGAA